VKIKIQQNLIFLIFTLVIHSVYQVFFPGLNPDKIIQLSTAINYLNGNGISITYFNLNTGLNYYSNITLWPPGYALLVSLFLKLTNNIIISDIIINIISVFILFISLYFILDELKMFKTINEFAVSLIFIFLSFCSEPFRSLTTTDFISLAFYVWSFFFMLKLFIHYNNNSGKRNYYYITVISILLFLSCFFRYAYYPLITVFPIILCIRLWTTRNLKIIIETIYGLFLIGLLISGLLIYTKLKSAGSFNIFEDRFRYLHVGNNWSNLLSFDSIFRNPFLSKGYPESYVYKLLMKIHFNFLPKTIFYSFIDSCLSIFVFFVILLGIVNFYKNGKIKWYNTRDPLSIFMLISLLVIVINAVFMSYLSIKFPITDGFEIFTFVSERRYFALTFILIVLIFIIIFQSNLNLLPPILRKVSLIFIILSLCLNIMKQMSYYNSYKQFILNSGKYDYYYLNAFQDIVKTDKAVLVDDLKRSEYWKWMSLAGSSICDKHDFIKHSKVNYNQNFIIVLPADNLSIIDNQLNQYCNDHHAENIYTNKGYKFCYIKCKTNLR
jgi:hypothetical protein